MPYPGPPFEFSAARPFRIVLDADDDSDLYFLSKESKKKPTIKGTVELHLMYAQQRQVKQVNLTFTGAVKTNLHGGKHRYYDAEYLAPETKRTLWQMGTAFPPPGEHILVLPFSITLPSNSPPSIHAQGRDCQANVEYKLEVEGERGVSFGMNIYDRRCLTVVPSGLNVGGSRPKIEDLLLKETVDIRRSTLFKAGKGQLEMKLCIPGYKHRPLPINTDIPFVIKLTTHSIPVPKTSQPGADKDALFPSIDTNALHRLLKLKLQRTTNIRVGGPECLGTINKGRSVVENELAFLGDLDKKGKIHSNVGVKSWVALPEDVAVGEMKGKGCWKQEILIYATMNLSSEFATPTFKHMLVDTNYALSLECSIPGQLSLGTDNHVQIKFPIIISSGLPLISDADVGRFYSAY